MKYIYNDSTDPCFNLAAEEYLLKSFPDDVFMLWVNRDVIVVGRNQNTMAEIDYDYVREHDIAVVRRLTGGGAVFHDKGNLNYTFITAAAPPDNSEAGEIQTLDFAFFGRIIIGALQTLGLPAALSGRNDLVLTDENGPRKFSGTAQTVQGGRILHHGTLMLNLAVDTLTRALRVSPEKIAGKGVKSVRSRVTNLNEHLPVPLTVPQLVDVIAGHVRREYPAIEPYAFTAADRQAIDRLADGKYRTWEWNYGSSPRYNFQKDTAFSAGHIQARLRVEGGVITEARLFGDYFGREDVAALEAGLAGRRHERGALLDWLSSQPVADYMMGATAEDLAAALI